MSFNFNEKYPFTSHFLAIDGLRYHYLDEGDGQPVVMLHGNPSWSFYYRNLVLRLRGSYRCIVPDHMGCGFSDKPQDDRYDYTLERRVEDLDRLLDHLGIRQNISLVLHDWGGMIGMTWAARNPERLSRLVILNTAAFHLPQEKRFPLPLRICRDTVLGTLLVRGCNAFSMAASFVCCTKNPMPAELRAAYRMPYDSWRNRIATLRFVQDIPLRQGDRNYELITSVDQHLHLFRRLPMLICWGERDFVFDVHFLNEWLRRFPEAEVHRFPEHGHYILEDAREEVVPLIADFMKRTG